MQFGELARRFELLFCRAVRIAALLNRHFLDLEWNLFGPVWQRGQNDMRCNICPHRTRPIERLQVVQGAIVDKTRRT